MDTTVSETKVHAWARLVRASQTAMARIEADLKAAGLPPLEWYDVLLELERAADGRLRPSEIAERMLLARYNITRLADRLEAKGLVVRDACAEDGRGAVVAITESGREMRQRMWPVYQAAIGRHFAERLSEKDATMLTDVLGRLLQAPRDLSRSLE